MIRSVFTLLMTLSLLCTTPFLIALEKVYATDISKKNRPVTVRILLTKLASDAVVEVRGKHLIYNPKSDRLIASGKKKRRGKVKTGKNGLIWGKKYPGLFEMRIVPTDQGTLLINGTEYKGCVEIYSIGGTINIINEVAVDHFLKSTLPAKVPANLSKEVLDAISIVERTYLYYAIQNNSYSSWQLDAKRVRYMGSRPAYQNLPIQQAINRTRDLILHYKKKPFPASWSLDHAGSSVSYSSIFRKNVDAPKGVATLPSIHDRSRHKWRGSVPIKTLAKLSHLSEIKEIDLFQAGKKGKIYAIRIKGREGKRDLDYFTLQTTLGSNGIQSNDFEIHLRGKIVHFIGHGKGNGVGLCAESAQIMAKKNLSVENILLTHFPQSELINIREEMGQSLNRNPVWEH